MSSVMKASAQQCKNITELYLSVRKEKTSRLRMLKCCMVKLLEKLLGKGNEIPREYE